MVRGRLRIGVRARVRGSVKSEKELVLEPGVSIEGSLINEKTLTIASGAGQVLGLTGSYTATSKATTTFTIAGSANFAKISAGAAVTIGGKLSLKQVKFTAKAGETFVIIGGGPLGTSLPFAGGGVLAVAAVAVVGGIFIKRRQR